MRIRPFLLWGAFGIASISFCLLALEVLIRVSGRADHLFTQPAFELSAHADYWRYRPSFEGRLLGPTQTRIGPLGNRLHGSPRTRPHQAVTVVICGDSVTFGQAVDEQSTFSARLETTLRDAGLPIEVLNFGVQGHTLEMEVAHVADRLGQIHPAVAVLAFVSDDLNPERAENHVDRFGYLTKNVFGAPSYWRDWVRAGLRHSYLALLTKDAALRMRASHRPGEASTSGVNADLEPEISRIRASMKRFDELTQGMQRVVICLDLSETPLTRRIQNIMRSEFPQLTYLHAPPALAQLSPAAWRVSRDGHPSATVHKVYAELLVPPVAVAVRSALGHTDPGNSGGPRLAAEPE